uniref:Uncharacterized protein n=1 Tax=Glossina brevipalpis TaxID=37001 RepID=A0A1A9WKA9_9MUSC
MLTNVVVKNEPLDSNLEDMIAQQFTTKQEFCLDLFNNNNNTFGNTLAVDQKSLFNLQLK